MNKKYENILLALFIINWIITIVLGYIGIYNTIGNSTLGTIIGLTFWIINGYIHMRAYSAVIDDYNEKNKKKQP